MNSIEDTQFKIADSLKRRRLELGMTQAELGEAVGMQQSHIARMEVTGPRSVSGLLVIAQALNMGIVLEPSKTIEAVKHVLEAENAEELDEAMEELFDSPPDDALVPPVVLEKAGTLKGTGTCKVHGTPLDGRGKCLVKGCKNG